MATPAQSPAKREAGLIFWMRRVIEEAERARRDFAEEPVHDLRVAIRRCRSMAEVFRALDRDRDWQKMRRAGKALFSALGELRDVQVQKLWVEKLGVRGTGAEKLLAHFGAREHLLKQSAAAALQGFDAREWLAWGEALERRRHRIRDGSPVFQAVALEKLQAARALHRKAARHERGPALHALRIGVKRFRYVVENFLPEAHERIGKKMKHVQDLLGDIHDLDVLEQTASEIGGFHGEEQSAWQRAVDQARAERVTDYRRLAAGRDGIWQQWRGELPRGGELAAAVAEKFASWAAFRDADMQHTRRVLRYATRLFDALSSAAKRRSVSERDLLTAAILGHEASGKRPKRALRVWKRFGAPAGWSDRELQIASLVARYERGRLPAHSPRDYAGLSAADRRTVDRLTAIVRLCEAMSRHRPALRLGRISVGDGSVVIAASNYQPRSRAAERITRASHLMQVVFDTAVRIKR